MLRELRVCMGGSLHVDLKPLGQQLKRRRVWLQLQPLLETARRLASARRSACLLQSEHALVARCRCI